MNSTTGQMFLSYPTASQQAAADAAAIQKRENTATPLQDVEDFSTVCRTCATVTEFVMPIFEGEGLQNNLAEKIQKHLPIKVSSSDVLPRVVCYQCASTLLAWHELVQCCEQADAALRTRLAVPRRAHKPESESARAETNQEPDHFRGFEIEYVVETLARPRPSAPAGGPRACPYCGSARHSDASYRDHLLAYHADLLFHCSECDTYVDRKEFIVHMGMHAVEYGAEEERLEMKRDVKKEISRLREKREVKSERRGFKKIDVPPQNVERLVNLGSERIVNLGSERVVNLGSERVVNLGSERVTDPQENEFSDHSDMDGMFDPLPESVFEAIADTQDGAGRIGRPTENDGAIRDDVETSSDNVEPNRDKAEPNRDNAEPNRDNVEPIRDVVQLIRNNVEPTRSNVDPTRDNIEVVGESNGDVATVEVPVKKGSKNHKKPRTCPICGKEYRASSSYFYHMKHSHRQSKEHECDLCGKKFGTRAYLAEHRTIHTGESPHACAECGKRFRSKASLYIHAQTHSGAKGWACAQCGRAFRWRAQLARHARRHAGERAHACGACPRAFSVRADLLRHARTHAARALACDLCGLRFAQPRYLKVHVQRKHGPDSENKQKRSGRIAAR